MARRPTKPPTSRGLLLLSYLLTFIFGAAAGLAGSRLIGNNRPPSTPSPSPGTPDQSAVIKQLETHLSHAPDDAEARVQLGNAYFDAGNFESAIIHYSRALELRPRNPDVIVDLGIAYREIGKSEAGVARFREALAINPRHVNARYNLGLVLKTDLHDFRGAIAAWDTLLTIIPTHEKAAWIREQLAQMKRQPGS
ncbi:MAG: tetratricopeptide repeat protein [Candidatus Latescibacteria bacterium]|nr:tetratricopeptide repeat protein [Candidatus Latescibacterota bacterium]